MLNVSRLADYAVNVLVCLAKENNESLSSQAIATQTKLALPTVKKVLKMLIKQHLIGSHQGVKGGYALNKKPDNISVADIIEAIDGPIALTHCCQKTDACRLKAACQTEEAWQGINLFIKGALNAVNLLQISQHGQNIMDHLHIIQKQGVAHHV